MIRWRTYLPLSFVFLLVCSLLLAGCGDSTPTPAPATATTIAATTAAITSAAPTTTAPTTAAATTSAPATTVATTTTIAPTATSALTTPTATTMSVADSMISSMTVTAQAVSLTSPVSLVRKIDVSKNRPAEPGSMDVDGQGNIFVADESNDRVLKFDHSGTLMAQWGKRGTNDGEFAFAAPPGGQNNVGFITFDNQGNLLVSDSYNDRIQKFDGSGKFLAKWNLSQLYQSEGKFAGVSTKFLGPISVDPQNNIYVAAGQGNILKLDSQGKLLAKWGSAGSEDGQFGFAGKIVFDRAGNIYVSDILNSRVQKFSADGKFLTKFGSSGQGDGQFNIPINIAIDKADNLYVADAYNGRVQKLSSSGKYLAQWTSPARGEPNFQNPQGIAIDSKGFIYITDIGSNNIYQFKPNP